MAVNHLVGGSIPSRGAIFSSANSRDLRVNRRPRRGLLVYGRVFKYLRRPTHHSRWLRMLISWPFGSLTWNRLVGQRILDRIASRDCVGMNPVNVCNLDRHNHILVLNARSLSANQADLGGRIGRRCKRDDPVHVHDNLEAKKLRVERSALIEPSGRNIRYYSFDVQWALP